MIEFFKFASTFIFYNTISLSLFVSCNIFHTNPLLSQNFILFLIYFNRLRVDINLHEYLLINCIVLWFGRTKKFSCSDDT